MPQTTVLLILLSAVIAIVLAGFQYFFRSNNAGKYRWALASLRAAAIFCLLLLLINPKFRSTEYYTEKPDLLLAVDHSSSIDKLGKSQAVMDFVTAFTEDQDIQQRFTVHTYAFGSSVRPLDGITFTDPQTNIQEALRQLKTLHKDNIAPTILITDGNQTFGRDYRFEVQNYNQAIFPVVVGDTTAHRDLSISRINVNKYAFLNNRFPVEIFVNYSGNEAVQTELTIMSGSSKVFSETISMDGSKTSQIIETTLPASQVGVLDYEVKVQPLANEKNQNNNQRNFSIEVIDEGSTVLLVSDLSHPDLGALRKSIESNQQRKVQLLKVREVPEELEEFSLVILYQPTTSFGPLLGRLKAADKNYFIITGPETDWDFLNREQDYFSKEIGPQEEEYFPELNRGFGAFQVEELTFADFPPLTDVFGEISTMETTGILLFQEVQGISTESPLMAFVEENTSRKAFLFGAGLWRWRAEVYAQENSFQSFDNFISKLVQFLASTKRKERLSIANEHFYYGNEDIVVSAQYFDKNYSFDPRGNLTLTLVNEGTEERREIPMGLSDNQYQLNLQGLSPGRFEFSIKVEGENLQQSGAFNVLDFEVEDQFTNADLAGLQYIAGESDAEVFFLDRADELKEVLLSEKKHLPVQKSRINHVYLADWYYLLAFIAIFLSAEWFLRKYHGLI